MLACAPEAHILGHHILKLFKVTLLLFKYKYKVHQNFKVLEQHTNR